MLRRTRRSGVTIFRLAAAKCEPVNARRRARVQPIIVKADASAAVDRSEVLRLVGVMTGIQVKRDDAAAFAVLISARVHQSAGGEIRQAFERLILENADLRFEQFGKLDLYRD